MNDKYGEWISVNEALPEVDEDVLCSIDSMRVGVLWLDKDGKWLSDEYGTEDGVTHWMPLPKPVEKGG